MHEIDFDGQRKWQVLPSMIEGRGCFTLVAMAGLLIAAGGLNEGHSLASAESFDLNNNHEPRSWRLLPSMSTARNSFAAASVSTHLFVCGGEIYQGFQNRRSLNSMERFDHAEGPKACGDLQCQCPWQRWAAPQQASEVRSTLLVVGCTVA